MTNQPPVEKMDHYTLIRSLGQGGMGQVYLAEDSHLGRKVAIKFVPSSLAMDEKAMNRFRNEARALAKMNHPNIVTVHEIGEFEGKPYIVLEFLEGTAFNELIKSHNVSVQEALRLMFQVGEGLKEAHAAGIIHRDIKPANLFVNERGQVKILDFGLAKMTTGDDLTEDHQTLGTHGFIAPEQIQGGAISVQSDIFALGVTFYALLTGVYPFKREHIPATLFAIVEDDPPPLSQHLDGDVSHLQKILDKMLAKSPHKRYANIGAFLEDLRACPEFDYSEIQSSVSFTRTQNKPKKTWFLALMGLLLLASSFWFFRPKPSPAVESDKISLAVFPFELKGQSEWAYLEEGMVDLLSTKFDGAGEIRAVDPRNLLARIRQKNWDGSVAQSSRMAQSFSSQYYVLGTMLEAAGQLAFEAGLYESGSQQPVAYASCKGPASDIFEMVDQLATQLLSELVSGRVAPRHLALMTTSSLEALKLFLNGEQSFRQGHFETAKGHLENALEVDPQFALAHYRLSVVADWLADPDLSLHHAEKAFELSHKLNDHDRLLLEALLDWRNGKFHAAEQAYRNILGSYPDDVEATIQIAEVLFHYGPYMGKTLSDAKTFFASATEIEPENITALWHLTRIATFEGDLAFAQRLTRQIEGLQPEGDRLLELKVLLAAAKNEASDDLLESFRQTSDFQIALSIWNAASYAKNIPFAISLVPALTQSTRSNESKALGHILAAYLHWSIGQIEQGREHLAQAMALDKKATSLFGGHLEILPFTYEPRLQTTLDLTAEALSEPITADPSSNLFLNVHQNVQEPILHYLRARTLIMLGRPPDDHLQALNTFEGSELQEQFSRNLKISCQAFAAEKRGDQDRAFSLRMGLDYETWYGLIVASPFFSHGLERFEVGQILADNPPRTLELESFWGNSIYDLVFKAQANFTLGMYLYEQGSPEQAKPYLEVFLGLYEQADPAFAWQVEQVKTILGKN